MAIASSQIKMSYNDFVSSVRPGITSLVMKEFERDLIKSIEESVDLTFERLRESLPNKIEVAIGRALELDRTDIVVQVNFNKPEEENK